MQKDFHVNHTLVMRTILKTKAKPETIKCFEKNSCSFMHNWCTGLCGNLTVIQVLKDQEKNQFKFTYKARLI